MEKNYNDKFHNFKMNKFLTYQKVKQYVKIKIWCYNFFWLIYVCACKIILMLKRDIWVNKSLNVKTNNQLMVCVKGNKISKYKRGLCNIYFNFKEGLYRFSK